MSYFSFVAITQKHLKEFTDSTLSDRNEDSFALAVFYMDSGMSANKLSYPKGSFRCTPSSARRGTHNQSRLFHHARP